MKGLALCWPLLKAGAMNKRLVYWVCQLSGWFLYGLFSIGMITAFGGQVNADMLWIQATILLVLVALSHLYRFYVKQKRWATLKVKSLLPKVAVSVILLSIIAQFIIHFFIYFVLPIQNLARFDWANFFGYTAGICMVMVIWATIYFSFQFIQRNRKSEIEKLELKSALQEAELAILKNQINPHFLFNALNNIRSLILTEPDRARKMVTHISELLRYSIQFNASEKVSLSQELEIVKDYLQLESIQFNNRLTYHFQIDEQSLNVKIPPMAIQLLVENAIKHGISELSTGGAIQIMASMMEDHLKIEVVNDGQLQSRKSEGIGLKNLIERMKILFGQFADLQLENSSSSTVTASLKIPLT